MAPYFMPYFTSCRRTFRLGAIAVAVALLASVACAHNDVVPYSNGTKILTGGHSDLAGTTDELLSAFGYDFGEDPNDPWVIGDPGFNNSSAFTTSFPNAGALSAGTLALSVFSGNYGSLHYWDGTGTSAAFSPVASGVEINLNRGSNNLRIGGATASGSLSIATILAAGRLHQHLHQPGCWRKRRIVYNPWCGRRHLCLWGNPLFWWPLIRPDLFCLQRRHERSNPRRRD